MSTKTSLPNKATFRGFRMPGIFAEHYLTSLPEKSGPDYSRGHGKGIS
jgi:hypothetical protein